MFAPRGEFAWALLNLILCICGVLFAVVAGARMYIREKRRRDEEDLDELDYIDEPTSDIEFNGAESSLISSADYDDEYDDEYDEELDEDREKLRKRRLIWLIVSAAAALIGVILFIVTQDMTLPMVFIDRWTIAHAILLAIGIVGAVLVVKKIRRKYDEEDEEYDEPDDLDHEDLGAVSVQY